MRIGNYFYKVKYKMKQCSSFFFRKKVVKKMREQNHIQSCSVISSNCIGCLLLHDLQMRFNSPTVNLFFTAQDFVKFAERIDYYLNINLTDVEMDFTRGYPVGLLDDIHIYFVHYKTCEECIIKWEERKKRIDFDQILFIFTDRNGLTLDLLKRYLSLPYKKIIYVSKEEYMLSDECIHVPGFEKKSCVGEMDKYADYLGHRYYEKYFNIVKWLND